MTGSPSFVPTTLPCPPPAGTSTGGGEGGCFCRGVGCIRASHQRPRAAGQALPIPRQAARCLSPDASPRRGGAGQFIPISFLRKSTLLEVGGYDSRFDGTEDIELQSRLARLGDILTIPEPLVLYRVHAPAMSVQRFMQTRALARFIAKRRRHAAAGKAVDLPSMMRCATHPAPSARFSSR